MDTDQKRRQLLGTIHTIAMAALEIQPDDRPAFIKRTVTMVRRYYQQTYAADPDIAHLASKLPQLTREMVRTLEESGGTIGHA